MTIAQAEHISTFRDPLPALTTMERMAELFKRREYWLAVVVDSNINELAQANLRFAEIEREIVEVARQIVAEADNAELIAERNTE